VAKENVAKFYEKLAQDEVLVEKLNALDKDFAEKNEAPADDTDIAFREKAAAAIVLPLAKEVGLPFTIEELKEYEQDQLKKMNLSEDELDQVAGGGRPGYKNNRSKPSSGGRTGLNACAYVGVGFGTSRKNGKFAACVFIGGSSGPMAG
jgi:hypothetical protein